MVVVSRWKNAGEWRYVGGSNNVMGCVWGVVYDMWDPRGVGYVSRRLIKYNAEKTMRIKTYSK